MCGLVENDWTIVFDVLREGLNVWPLGRDGHAEGILSEVDEGTLMGGCRSISNDDAIDWLRNPVVPWCVCDLPFLFFFFHLQDEAETGRESWSPGCPRKNVHWAANPGIGLHKGINIRVRGVFTAERDVELQYSILTPQ